MSAVRFVWFFAGAIMFALGCLPAAPVEPAEGAEGGPCRADGTCDDALSCASDVCVKLPVEGEDEGEGEGEAIDGGVVDGGDAGANEDDAGGADAGSDAGSLVPNEVPEPLAVTPLEQQVGGLDVYSWFPTDDDAQAAVSGVVWLFHGTGGSASAWTSSVENARLLNRLMQAGFGFVATESSDRLTDVNALRQWSPVPNDPASNADMQHLVAVRSALVSAGRLSVSTPAFGLGHSNGGGFVTYVGYVSDFAAVAVFGAEGYGQVFTQPDYAIPVVLVHSENDPFVPPAESAVALETLIAANVYAARYVKHEEPLAWDRFVRIPGISASDSLRIYDALDGVGAFDEDGYLAQDPAGAPWQSALPADLAAFHKAIGDQLSVVYAGHKLSSDLREEVTTFFVAHLPSADFAPGFSWSAVGYGPTDDDEVDAVAADSEGNVFVSGRFRQSLTLGGATKLGFGSDDIFVAKFDATGTMQWLEVFGGAGSDNVFDAVVDSEGNLVMSGWFSGTVDFGAHELTSAGGTDVVIMKMSPDGVVLWAERAGGSGPDGGNEVTVDSADRILVLAGSGGTFAYGGASFANAGFQDAYLLVLDKQGGLEWARALAGSGHNRAKALGVDGQDHIYFGGDTAQSASLVAYVPGAGAVPLAGVAPLTSAGGADAFLTRWTPSGELVWAKRWGGSGDDICKGVVGDAQGNAYTAGSFEGTFTEAETALTFTSDGETDLLLRRFAPTGAHLWTHQVRSLTAAVGAEVEIDGRGGLVFAGGIAGESAFESSFGTTLLAGLGVQRGFVARYSPEGDLTWLLPATESSSTNAQELQRGGKNIYVDIVIRGTGNAFGPHAADAVQGKDFALVRVTTAE